MTSNELLKANVLALLKLRDKTPEDLARHVHNSKDWIQKIFRESRREIPIKYYAQIAKFVGVEVYQLLQPGIAGNAERRDGVDRRKHIDRRVSEAIISERALDVDIVHIVRAISLEGRRAAIKTLMDILNDELKHPRSTTTESVDPGHNADTPATKRVRRRTRTE